MPLPKFEIPNASNYTLTRARIPLSVLATPIDGAKPDDEDCALFNIAIADGKVTSVTATAEADPEAVDLAGRIVLPGLVEVHAHLDKGQVFPRAKPDGSLYGGHSRTLNDRAHWTRREIGLRMEFGLQCAYAHGVSAIRTHIDSPDWQIAERGFAALGEMRAQWRERIVLQGVTITPMASYLTPLGEKLANLAAEQGDIMGGVTDAWDDGVAFEKLDAALDRLFQLAGERGLDVDLHVDQTEKVKDFTIPNIARAKMRNRFEGKVTCDHCVNLVLQPDEVIDETLALAREAGLSFTSMPTPMMYLLDRRPGRTPKWRGVTAAKEILAAGLPFAVGGDNCRDSWFPFGDHDMLDTFKQAVRVFQCDDPISDFLKCVTVAPADIMGISWLGRIATGLPAKLVILNARSLNTLMCRDQSDRVVLDRGAVVRETLPSHEDLAEALAAEARAAVKTNIHA